MFLLRQKHTVWMSVRHSQAMLLFLNEIFLIFILHVLHISLFDIFILLPISWKGFVLVKFKYNCIYFKQKSFTHWQVTAVWPAALVLAIAIFCYSFSLTCHLNYLNNGFFVFMYVFSNDNFAQMTAMTRKLTWLWLVVVSSFTFECWQFHCLFFHIFWRINYFTCVGNISFVKTGYIKTFFMFEPEDR